MKNLILFFALMLTFNLSAQKRISFECFDCRKIESKDCDVCKTSDVNKMYLNGILVRFDNAAPVALHKPFKVWTKGRSVYVKDFEGTQVRIPANKTVYNKLGDLVDAVLDCNCGSADTNTTYVTTQSEPDENGVITYTEMAYDIDGNEVGTQTFTSIDTDTQLSPAEVCVVVAENCNATFVENLDGTWTFIDNAGNPTLVTIENSTYELVKTDLCINDYVAKQYAWTVNGTKIFEDTICTNKLCEPITGIVQGELFETECGLYCSTISSNDTCDGGERLTYDLSTNVETGFIFLNSDGSFCYQSPSNVEDCPIDYQTFETNIFCNGELIGTGSDTISIITPQPAPLATSFNTTSSVAMDKLDGTGDFSSKFEFLNPDGVPLDQACADFVTSCFEVRITIPTVSVPLEATICQGDNDFSNQTADWATYIDPIVQAITWSGNEISYEVEKRDGALAMTTSQVGNIAGTGVPRTQNHDGTTSQGQDWIMEMRIDDQSCNGPSNWAQTVIETKCERTAMFLTNTSSGTSLTKVVSNIRILLDGSTNNSGILGGDKVNWEILAEREDGAITTGFQSYDAYWLPTWSIGDLTNSSLIGMSGGDFANFWNNTFIPDPFIGYAKYGHRGEISIADYPLENNIVFEQVQSNWHGDGGDAASLLARGLSGNDDISCNEKQRRQQYGMNGNNAITRFGEITNATMSITNTATFNPAAPVITNSTGLNNSNYIETYPTAPGIYRYEISVEDNGIAPIGFNTAYEFLDIHVYTF